MPGFKGFFGWRQLGIKPLATQKKIDNTQITFKKVSWIK
jgi:hypothetical protein